MKNSVKPVPDGYHTATPYLVIAGAAKAIDFYAKAFGAKELFRMPGPGGIVTHAELQIGDTKLMLAEESSEMGTKSPMTLKGTPVGIFIYTADVDKLFKQAVAAGAKTVIPLADVPWGDRWGKLQDPFGHEWQLASRKEELTPEQVQKRMATAK